ARYLEVGVVLLPLAIEGEEHVVGIEFACRREGLAGVKLDGLAEVECDFEPVLGDIPAGGKTGHDLGRSGLELDQLIIDRTRCIERSSSLVQRRLKVLGAPFRA